MVRNKVLVLMLLLAGAGSVAVAAGRMRAHYEFEGNYSNNITGPAGVPHGNAHIVPDPGGNGKGTSDVLSLDGAGDYVRFGNDSVSGITGAVTLTCWTKTGSLPDLDSLVAKGYAWRLNGDSGPGQFATGGLSNEYLHGTINLADGQWHHLAGVYDGAKKYLYVDGNIDSHTDCTGLLNTWGDYVFSAGALLKEYSNSTPYDGFPKFFYAGLIDDIRVYDYALSEGEIESIISGDCNDNGVPDDDDIAAGTSFDCNGNGLPDECDIADGRSGDCNTNGIPDECEPDCNGNGIPDDCDIADATSVDTNENGVPDECESQYEAEDAVLNGTEAYAHQNASGGY
ncbi:MAG: LamG domain-containing protein, partial [Planctomycetes bacterium]|nr:LamG domain-containing protein [Planctomycetota bacterium]